MINITSTQHQNIQAQFFDASNNRILLPPDANVVFEITGPATLLDDPGETQRAPETSRKVLVSSGPVGSGVITAYYLRNLPGAVTVTEPYTVAAGPISQGVIVAI